MEALKSPSLPSLACPVPSYLPRPQARSHARSLLIRSFPPPPPPSLLPPSLRPSLPLAPAHYYATPCAQHAMH